MTKDQFEMRNAIKIVIWALEDLTEVSVDNSDYALDEINTIKQAVGRLLIRIDDDAKNEVEGIDISQEA